MTGSVYEWTQHWRIALDFGVPEADAAAVRGNWTSHAGFNDLDHAVLTAVDETCSAGAISSSTSATSAARLDDEALVELVLSIGNWRMFAGLLRSLEIPLEAVSLPGPRMDAGPTHPREGRTMNQSATTYPLSVELDAPLEVARWRPLVAWLLAIPHLIVIEALQLVAGCVTFVAFFAILFTGQYPVGMFNIVVMTHRYSWRSVSYLLWIASRIRRSSSRASPKIPAAIRLRLSITYPETMSRGLPFVKWLLAFPHYVALFVLLGGHVRVLADITRPQALLLSTGANTGHPRPTKIYDYFHKNLKLLDVPDRLRADASFIQRLAKRRSKALRMLAMADLGITDAKIEQSERSPEEDEELR